jgi:multidrug efflux pump subunit AcrA (membrane-fusion protein)
MTPRTRRLHAFAWTRILWIIVAIAAIGGGVYAAVQFSRPTVTTTTLVRGPVIQAVYATGTIQPVREYPIRSNTAGIIEAVHVDKGSRVKLDMPLAVVADPALKYAAEKAQAELVEKQGRVAPVIAEYDARILAMQARLDIAQREESRLRKLVESGTTSTTDLDRSSDVVKSLWSELESLKSQRTMRSLELDREIAVARSAVGTAEWNLHQQTLKSPIDAGTVLDRPLSPGTRVAVNDVVMRVADVSPANLVMRAAVDEEDITRVKLGQRVIVTLYAFDGAHFEGKVTQIYPEADPTRRTFEVDVALGDDARKKELQSGMTGEIAFVIATKDDVKVLPSQSLQENAVYVLRGGKIERLEPKIGIRAVDRIEVLEGVPDDAVVIISPVTRDQVGTSARETRMDPHEAAGLNKPKDVTFRGMGG